MRVIGMGIHRTFAGVVMVDGDKLVRLGRVNMSRRRRGDRQCPGGRGGDRTRGHRQPEAGASYCQGADQDRRHRRDGTRSPVRERVPARGLGAGLEDDEPAPAGHAAQPDGCVNVYACKP